VLALGRRRRRPSSAIRRAARERDNCRCRFPGCESRRVDLHHIQHWVNGGRTDLDNLISLCPYHHKVVHDRGYLIAVPPGSAGFAFCHPDGSPLPACPALPEPEGSIGETHEADITPDTIIPPWYGERLDLHHAIWACFANARTNEEKPSRPGAGSGVRLPAEVMGWRLQHHGRVHPPLLRRTPSRLMILRSTIASPFSRLVRTETDKANEKTERAPTTRWPGPATEAVPGRRSRRTPPTSWAQFPA
jgi:HNH endonuclease